MTQSSAIGSGYTKATYPIFVCHHGLWDIQRNARGQCAAIPTEAGESVGCRASFFGDLDYVRLVLADEYRAAQQAREAMETDALTYALALASELPA